MGFIYRQQGRTIWMMKYYRDGRPIVESAGTDNEKAARKLLRSRETDIDRGLPLSAKVGKLRFEEAARDIETDYVTNGRRSVSDLQCRIRLHLAPAFGGRRMAGIMTADVRTYTKTRLAEGAEPATINRELAVLKRMFVLAVHGGKLLHRPHIPMLKEHNVRTGFFERDQFEAVRAHLHEIYRGATTFMYLTGWRIQSEVLCLQWPQVDWSSALIRLHPGTTKNDEGRMFPFDLLPELRDVLEAQRARTDRLKGRICPWVFHEAGRPFLDDTGHASHDFRAAWTAATTAAGCPGRIPHDFRRTAVRNLIRAGVSEKTAMQLTGHKTRAVFDRYDIVDERDLREAVRRLAAAPAPPSASRGRVLRVRKQR